MSAFNENGIKKTGRTSSQRSIYDYPEHLNPFSDDDNHKRLRFWKINSENKKPGRSNSFSLVGLKGLWSFKTFRLKKKSSTLGINKTSESPPRLRQEDEQYNNNRLFDSRIRHTVDVGLGNNFSRGSTYRSSLQDINSPTRLQQDNAFLRNNRYRSTMQNGNASNSNRYNSDELRSITPTLRTKYIRPGLSRGSSQTSVNSSNPFDDDYVDTISQVGSVDGVSMRSGRKKRRAPPPPTSPNMSNKTITILEESSSETVASANKCNGTDNITNLTAEIESFVKTADTDKESIQATNTVVLRIEESENATAACEREQNDKTKASRQSPESNDYYPDGEPIEHISSGQVTIEKIQNLGTTTDDADDYTNNCERSKRSPVKILIRAPTDEELDDDIPITVVKIDGEKYEENAKETTTESEHNKHTNPISNLINKDIREIANTTPTSTEVEFILENDNQDKLEDSNISELRITESTDDLTNIENTSNVKYEVSNIPLAPSSPVAIEKLVHLQKDQSPERQCNKANESTSVNSKYDVRTIPLKNFSPLPSRKDAQIEPLADDSEVVIRNKGPPTPPQRRRSVKEIIESINRSQSLLRFNQDQRQNKIETKPINTLTTFQYPTTINEINGLDRNMNDLSVKEYHEKKMFSDVIEINNNNNCNEIDNLPLVVERFTELNNNNPSLFERCVVRRRDQTQNGIKENVGEKSNVEWNPVPKPRRHRHSAQGTIN